MKNELISVIIPVYNMEKYLKECMDSIFAQTYQNLEIILVDDGSTDASPQLCDAYTEQDRRVKVIHQKNKGLSGARNTGIEHATGAYLAFVDPDDCCHNKLYELLYRALCDSDSDIACCSYSTFIDGEEKEEYQYDQYTQKFSCKEHVLALFNGDSRPLGFAWNKLYRREVIGDIRFVVGRTIEDYYFNLDVFAKAKSLIFIEEKLYYYRQRQGSILNRGGENLKLAQDFAAACSHQIEVFRAVESEQEFISCLDYALRQFAIQEAIAYFKGSTQTRKLYRELFLSTFQDYKKYFFQLKSWKTLFLARYVLPLYRLRKKKQIFRDNNMNK